ncbi:MAG: PPC domain-containing protein [Myxococcota bacterium]
MSGKAGVGIEAAFAPHLPAPTQRWLLLLAGLLLFSSPGCPADEDDNGVDPIVPAECEGREDCEGGLVCINGFCTHCSRDRDCLEYEMCDPVTLSCEPLEDWGVDCSLHDECALGEFCVQGLCRTGEDVIPCANDAQCPEGEYCHPERLVCEEDLGCFDDSRCPEDHYCNLATNRCERTCTEENAEEVCPEGFRCEGGRCVECVVDEDCGAGLTCDPEAGRCRGETHCFSDRDCLRPLVCNRKTGQCTEQPPPCVSSSDCVPGEVCEIRTGSCVSGECLPDDYEPNGSLEEAAQIEPGLYSNLTLCDGADDWFLLTLGAGDAISVTVTPPSLSGGNYSVSLLRPGGEQVLAQAGLQIDHTVQESGDHPLRIGTTDERSTYSMQVLVSRGEPCDDDPHEPNDFMAEAASLSEGAHYNLVRCPGNPDWFLVAHERESVMEVSLIHEPLDGDLDLYVYDSDGTTLIGKSAGTDPVESVEVEGTSAGRFFIEIVADQRVSNSYDLVLEVL